MTTVTVDATRRLARFSLEPTFVPSGKVFAHDEVLVQEPASEEDQAAYGTMHGASVEREFGNVIDQTVTVDGMTISFQTLINAATSFFEKWRQEDIDNPPVLDGSSAELPSPPE